MSHADLAILVPSRGRPQNILRLLDTFLETAPKTDLIVGVDADDPMLDGYHKVMAEHMASRKMLVASDTDGVGMVSALNRLADRYAVDYEMVGFMGDDHLPEGDWVTQVTNALGQMKTGMVYGDDGIQGPYLPTAVFMTSDIVRTLGWMAPPPLEHLYVDSAWLELGRAAHCLTYLPHLKITHLHPSAGLSEWDERYRATGSAAQNNRDKEAFRLWQQFDLPASARLVRDLVRQRRGE